MAKHKLVVIYDDELAQFWTDTAPIPLTVSAKVAQAQDALMYACKDLNGGTWAEWL